MSGYETMRELCAMDAREVFSEPSNAGQSTRTREYELVCLYCENGYHDHAEDISEVMECTCACHERLDKRAIISR